MLFGLIRRLNLLSITGYAHLQCLFCAHAMFDVTSFPTILSGIRRHFKRSVDTLIGQTTVTDCRHTTQFKLMQQVTATVYRCNVKYFKGKKNNMKNMKALGLVVLKIPFFRPRDLLMQPTETV